MYRFTSDRHHTERAWTNWLYDNLTVSSYLCYNSKKFNPKILSTLQMTLYTKSLKLTKVCLNQTKVKTHAVHPKPLLVLLGVQNNKWPARWYLTMIMPPAAGSGCRFRIKHFPANDKTLFIKPISHVWNHWVRFVWKLGIVGFLSKYWFQPSVFLLQSSSIFNLCTKKI